MNLAAVVAISAAAVGLVTGIITLRFSTAPGWRDLRWFAFGSFTVVIYSSLNTVFTMRLPESTYVLSTRIQMASGYLFAAFLLVYTIRRLGTKLGTFDKTLLAISLAATVFTPIPGAHFTDHINYEDVPALGLTYAIVRPTEVGMVLMALVPLIAIVCLVHFARAIRTGQRGLTAPCIALTTSLVITACDVLTSNGLLPFPYLSDVGFCILVLLIGIETTQRFVAGANTLEALTERLEVRVKERTAELNEMHSQLLRAEKLAAIGQLSAGIAHEINNPAAAIEANLFYLDRALTEQYDFPSDARECLDESQVGVQRIARIARQLLDAGRSASASEGHEYLLCRAVDAAARSARAATHRDVPIMTSVSNQLLVSGDQQLLEQVFTNVITNAIQAIPFDREGNISITAHEHGDWVEVLVEDDGVGMSDDTLKRAFEPFFTTRELNEGTGLGLSVSLGLLHAVRGDLTITSTLGKGTCACVVLRKPTTPVSIRPALTPQAEGQSST